MENDKEPKKEEKTVRYKTNGKEAKVLPETKEFLERVVIKPKDLEKEKKSK